MVPPQYHQPLVESAQPTNSDEARTLWIGDLHYWMDENYIASCFPQSVEILSIKLIRNHQTHQSEGYGFIELSTHSDANNILKTYNGSLMSSVKQKIKLNWAYYDAPLHAVVVKRKKNKMKGKENKGEENRPPLSSSPCKMCPNRDGHTAFDCPKLITPELKENRKFPNLCCPDKRCNICLKEDHWPETCPYQWRYPPGAVVGRHAAIICLCCGWEKPHPGVPGLDRKARVILNPVYPLPSLEEELMYLKLASDSEAATDATANNKSNT